MLAFVLISFSKTLCGGCDSRRRIILRSNTTAKDL